MTKTERQNLQELCEMAEANGCIIDRENKTQLPILVMIRSDIFSLGPEDTDKRAMFIMVYQGSFQRPNVVVNDLLRWVANDRFSNYMLGASQEGALSLKDLSVPEIKKTLCRIQKKIADTEQKILHASISNAGATLLKELAHEARPAGM